jgi:serine/threonine protein kinase
MSDSILKRLQRSGNRLSNFQLIRPIGKGGAAPVWLAMHLSEGVPFREVALKIFHREQTGVLTDTAAGVGTVPHEAHVLSQLNHANVVKFWTAEFDADLELFGLAMEYLNGETLEFRLRRGPLAVTELLQVAIAMASALVEIHSLGLVHRDVKPANIVHAGDTYKLIDFGVAGTTQAPLSTRSVDGIPLADTPPVSCWHLFGTVGYIDPIHYTGGQPTTLSDIYSLGATLYEAASGRKPGARRTSNPPPSDTDEGERVSGFDHQVLRGLAIPTPLGDMRPDLPRVLSTLIMRMLSPDPRERPADSLIVVATLERIRDSLNLNNAPELVHEQRGFKGFDPYRTEDASLFFFRNVETDNAFGLLRARRLVVVSGPEGCGKTSFVSAGLLARLRRGELGRWPRAWRELQPTQGMVVADVCRLLGVSRCPVADFLDYVEKSVEQRQVGVCLLMDDLRLDDMDQDDAEWLRELIVNTSENPRTGFLIVITLDATQGLPFGLERQLAANTFRIDSLPKAAWSDVVDKTLAAQGFSFQTTQLRTQVLAQLESPGMPMALAQLALQELWQHRDLKVRCLTQEAWDDMVGLHGSIARLGERVLEELGSAHEAQARSLLTTLVGPDSERLSVPRETVARRHPDSHYVLQRLIDAKLIRSRGNILMVSHDFIVHSWPRLTTWAVANRETARLWERLVRDAQHFDSTSSLLLWGGRDLQWARSLPDSVLSPREHQFVGASARAARLLTVRTAVVAVLTSAMLLLIAAGIKHMFVRLNLQIVRIDSPSEIADSRSVDSLIRETFPDNWREVKADLIRHLNERKQESMPKVSSPVAAAGALAATSAFNVQARSSKDGFAPFVASHGTPEVSLPKARVDRGVPFAGSAAPTPPAARSAPVAIGDQNDSKRGAGSLAFDERRRPNLSIDPPRRTPLEPSSAEPGTLLASVASTALRPIAAGIVQDRITGVIRSCATTEPAGSSQDLKVVVLVNSDGNVDWARVEGVQPSLKGCISERAMRENFGKNSSGTTVVGFPYRLVN